MLSLEEQNKLITNNMAMVTDIIRTKFRLGEDEWDDLFQEGCLALTVAARQYNPDLGYKFSTYAYPTITGYIRKYKRTKAMHLHGLHTPRSVQDNISNLTQFANKYNLDLSDSEDYELSTEVTGIKQDPILTSSLQKIVNNNKDEAFELGELISDTKNDYDSVDFSLFVDEIFETLKENFSTKNYLLLSHAIFHYLNTGDKISQKELADTFETSQGNTSRVLRKAYKLLKQKGVI